MGKVLVWVFVILLSGCKGSTGPAGPQGPKGPDAPSFQVEFEQGVYPDGGYSGFDTHWLDGGNPDTAPGTGEIKVATGSTISNVALGLVRFDLSYGIPSNATITAASLELTTETSTALSNGTYVFGIHQVIPPPAGEVPWNDLSTWNVLVVPYGWNGGSSSPVTAGADYNPVPMDALTVTSPQVNSAQVLLSWKITPSLAQVWVNKTNNNYGLLISSEPETSGTLSGLISFWDGTGNSQQKPKMLVTYTIP